MLFIFLETVLKALNPPYFEQWAFVSNKYPKFTIKIVFYVILNHVLYVEECFKMGYNDQAQSYRLESHKQVHELLRLYNILISNYNLL